MTALVPIRIEVHPTVGDPVIIRNDRTTPLTLVSFREPARQSRVEYAPTSRWQDDEMPMSLSRQQSLLGFDVAARGAASESAAQAAYAALDAATHSLSVPVHVVWHDHTQIWTCHAGSRVPATDRDYPNLRDHDAVWVVSLPCRSTPTSP